ncbi:MAG: hypothetical protein ACRD5L_12170 [Bryobacteraceae bacterium]
MESSLANRTSNPATRQTPEEIERSTQKADLTLSRIRILNDLQKAVNPRYRLILTESLDFLDQKLKLLE